MPYLEDNARFLGELQKHLSDQPLNAAGELIGRGNTMVTHTGGVFVSAAGEQIPYAFKYMIDSDSVRYLSERNQQTFVRSLGILATMHDKSGLRSSLFPRFYGMLVRDGKPIGQITEDFSEGNSRTVVDYPFNPNNRPPEVNCIVSTIGSFLERNRRELVAGGIEYRVSDYPDRILNDVSGVGPRIVDVFGPAIEPATDTSRMSEAHEKMDRMLGIKKIADQIDSYTVRLAA